MNGEVASGYEYGAQRNSYTNQRRDAICEDVSKGGSETAGEFEKRICKMSTNERVVAVKEKASKVAKENNLVKDSKLSKRNGRDI